MIAALVIGIILLAYGFALFALYTMHVQREAASAEAIRLTILAESAMSHIRAKDLAEVGKYRSEQKADDVQLAYLEKTLAKQEALEKEKNKKAEPVYAKTADGAEIDLADYEVVS